MTFLVKRTVPRNGLARVIGDSVRLGRDPLEFLREAARDGPITELRPFGLRFYLVSDPRIAQDTWVDESAFTRSRIFSGIRAVQGDSWFIGTGTQHHEHRRTVHGSFTRRAVGGYAEIMRLKTAGRIAQWRPGQVIPVRDVMIEITVAVTMECVLGMELLPTEVGAVHRALARCVPRVLIATLCPVALHVPTSGNRLWRRDMRLLSGIFDKAIDRRLARMPGPRDFLGRLFTRYDVTNEISPEVRNRLRGDLTNFIFAGIETTATTLAWTWYELASHPGIRERVHSEIDALPVTSPRQEDPGTPFLRRVIAETLRLHSPALLTRTTTRRMEIHGRTLPRGAELVVSPYVLHRSPGAFASPGDFDPDRPELDNVQGSAVYLPFGAGPYRCLGEHFAYAAMQNILLTIASDWELNLDQSQGAVREVFSSVPYPGNLRMKASPRK
jgi:cyclooctat-9-en-7-ol 5-monooxygenase